jgi:hypothetical protein
VTKKDLLQTQPKLKEQRIILHQRKRKAFKANPKNTCLKLTDTALGVIADSKFSINPETFKIVDNKLYLFLMEISTERK